MSSHDAAPPSDWTFLRRPRWLLSHLGVALLVLAMIVAGVWQIARHRDRGERNDTIRARADLPVADLAQVAPVGAGYEVGEAEQFRRVRVAGVMRPDDQVLIRNRSLDGAPGVWVLTPLVTDEGWAVAVNRGWLPLNTPLESVQPPAGQVELFGYVQPTRRAEGFQQADPADGVLTSMARTDLERLARQLDYELAPVVFQLAPTGFVDDGEPVELPVLVGLPALDAGPHASYAAQWFIFTTIALVGYPLILRRVARGQAESLPDDQAAAG